MIAKLEADAQQTATDMTELKNLVLSVAKGQQALTVALQQGGNNIDQSNGIVRVSSASASAKSEATAEAMRQAWQTATEDLSVVIGPYTKPEYKRTSAVVYKESGERYVGTGKEVTKFGILVTSRKSGHQYDIPLSDLLLLKLVKCDGLRKLADIAEERSITIESAGLPTVKQTETQFKSAAVGSVEL